MFLAESERLETLRACRDCPMCHAFDTMAVITGKECNTPRARAVTLWGLEKGLLDWESEGIPRILYQAFLDGLTREWCEGNYDVDELTIAGRKGLVEKGMAPPTVSAVARNIQATRNPFGLKEVGGNALAETLGGEIFSKPEALLYLGSTSRVKRFQTARAMVKILGYLAVPFEILEEESDSGFLSYQLGDFASAADQAKRIVARLQGTRARQLVVLGASDYRMFTTRYARLGAPLPEGLAVLHATEFLERALDQLKPVLSKIFSRVTYHDPSSLARFTYVLEPPRKILSALAGKNFIEMAWHGRKAPTCGETGGVEVTYPELSGKAARMRMEEAVRTGAEILVSADPECEDRLAQAGGLEVKNIAELVAEGI